MGPQRRSSDTPQPPDALVAPAPPPQLRAHPAANFHAAGKDAFRDKAALKVERQARRRAGQTARRETVAMDVGPPLAAESPAPPPLKFERKVAATPSAPAASPEFERTTAAIIPWPGRLRTAGLIKASTDAPEIERPPEVEKPVEPPKVDAPTADPKPAPPAASTPAAPFSAAEFWGRKKSGGGGGGGAGGGEGGGSGGALKRKRFNQDDVAGGVIVLLVLILIGWMGFNLLGKPSGDDKLLKPQSAAIPPAPQPPVVKPDPFPPGPIDLKPKSPMPEGAPAPEVETKQALVAPLVTTEPVVTTQAAPSPPTHASQPASTNCVPGRMIHAYFCTARSGLTPAARTALDADVETWRACAAGQELVVKGYADTRGSQAFNVALGESRAKQMADILRAQGLSVSTVIGVGKLDGLEDGQNCLNQRRVDVGLKSEIDAVTPSKACAPPKSVAPISCGPATPKPVADASSPAQ